MPGQQIHVGASLIINDKQYALDTSSDEPNATRQTVAIQPGEQDVEFERRIRNDGLGWGQSKYVGSGQYDYGDPAVLHQRGSFKAGAAVTDRIGDQSTPALNDSRVSFCEFWDGTPANRRLIIVTARHIYEYDSAGYTGEADIGATASVADPMTKGTLYQSSGMGAPRVYIARQSATDAHYMVERTGAHTYVVSPNNKFAAAIASGKDPTGAQVLWRVDEDGKLNQSVADGDASTSGAWSLAAYPDSFFHIGPVYGAVNDIIQQGKEMLIGKTSGAWKFDNVLNALPITVGMEKTPGDNAFRYFKDFNGMSISPTPQGLIWIQGLNWGTCGPVSANPDARNLRGVEVAVSSQAGEYIYCAVWDGTNSYIFIGTSRRQEETGRGPFTWHGPIAKIDKELTDMEISTVFGRKLWLGYTDSGAAGGWATIDLNSDFTPVTDQASGYIYLPEGILDLAGPNVIKDLRKAEFIAPSSTPFAATNAWTIEVETTPGSGSYIAIDGGVVNSGVTGERFWTTLTALRRGRVRLAYTGNTGNAEIEEVIIRGTERPETCLEFSFRVKLHETPTTAQSRLPKTRRTMLSELLALVADEHKATIKFGETSIQARVTHVAAVTERKGHTIIGEIAQVRIREIVLV